MRRLTRYALAKLLGVPHQSVIHYEEKGNALKLRVLSRLRKVSGLSWSKFGAMIDDEFGS